jgi:hypothetical protein
MAERLMNELKKKKKKNVSVQNRRSVFKRIYKITGDQKILWCSFETLNHLDFDGCELKRLQQA